MLNLNDILAVFLTEARELTEQLEQGLLSLEAANTEVDNELVNSLFRAAHTIKGSAGVVGLDDIVAFTHNVEAVLEQIRGGSLQPDKPLLSILLQCTDHINLLLTLAELQQTADKPTVATANALLKQLGPYLQMNSDDGAESGNMAVVPADTNIGKQHIVLLFPPACFVDGFDPLAVVRYLGQHCSISREYWHDYYLLPLKEITPDTAEQCYLLLDLIIDDAAPGLLADALEFVQSSKLLTANVGDEQQYSQMLEQLADAKLADYLKQCWQQAALWPQPAVEVENTAGQALSQEQTSSRNVQQDKRIMRVPAFKLDELVNQLGELVIASASLQERAAQLNNVELNETVLQIQSLVDDVQSSALQLRMVQIGETFNRFNRVVRDVAQELGKTVQLVIRGAETELDKSMVERISDPLMHLVRNALDHGLEAPEQRISAGKSAQGTLELSAYHDSGSFVIEIRDDGRGINRAKVLAKAIEKGIVPAQANLTDKQIDALIFEAGFSTADAVSNLSGRGVGMDVVRKNIEALRGTVDIHSTPGLGATFQLRLPLTLAIIDGFMVRVGDARFVIPLDMVNECIEYPANLFNSGQKADYLNLRSEVLPFLYLHQIFDLPYNPTDKRSIVVVRYGNLRAGLVVDQLLGEFQTVIKPLGKLFQFLQGISGSSILGSGDIALILDVPKLIQLHAAKGERSAPAVSVKGALP
ncbi:MAG: chemotaxis protein CheA [Gammaproteobacteria bacterium]|nr:chemotaxis protein CheA [Gammaproteobacteria bacterium]